MSKTILIADDTSVVRNIIKKTLSSVGYEIVGEAENGLIAVEEYNQQKPDLLIIDINMPEMDGISATKQIIANNPKAIIIMCTSSSQQDLLKEAKNSGVKAFLFKPFKTEELISAVEKVFT